MWKYLSSYLAYFDYLLPETSNTIRLVNSIWYAAKSEIHNHKLHMQLFLVCHYKANG